MEVIIGEVDQGRLAAASVIDESRRRVADIVRLVSGIAAGACSGYKLQNDSTTYRAI